ncbi:hypothetical protein [Varibaculum vaginae]|uniref:hypothetical protein n=1 Tax=Varibaculum vaginae TaxID=2364797 RepID=UPI000F092C3F|nr:hypothetical protein [Varibaculum vaginae]
MRLKNFAQTLVSGVCATALIPAGLLAVAAAGNLQGESPAGEINVTTSVANTPKFLSGCIGSDQLGSENVEIRNLPAGKDWFLTVSDSDQSPFPSRDSYRNPNGGGYMYIFNSDADANYRHIKEAVKDSGFGLAASYSFKSSVKHTYAWVFVQLEDELYGALKVNAGCDYDFSSVLDNNLFDKYLQIKKMLVNPQAVRQDVNPHLELHQFRAPAAGDFKVLDAAPEPLPETDPNTEPSHPDVPEVPESPAAPTVERQAPTLDASAKKPAPHAATQTSPRTGQADTTSQAKPQPTPVRTVVEYRESTRTVTVPGPIRFREAPNNASSSNNASGTDIPSTTANNSAKPAQEGSNSAKESTGNGTASQVQGVEKPKAAPSAPAAARAVSNPSVVDRMGGLGTIVAIAVLGLIGAGGAIALTRSLING